MSGTTLDLILLVVVAAALVRGWGRGSIRETFSLGGLLVGLVVAAFALGPVAGIMRTAFSTSLATSRLVGLGLILGVASLLGLYAGVRADKKVDLPGPVRLGKAGGAALALLRSAAVAALLFYGVVTVTTARTGFPKLAAAIDESIGASALADESSPFSMFYDALVNASDDLQAIQRWVRAETGERERVPGHRAVDFEATRKGLSVDRDAEREMLRLLNRDRRRRGVPPLKWCSKCAAVARAHSRDMYRNGYFAHVNKRGLDPFERMRRAKIRYAGIAGENLAIAPTVAEAEAGLMKSPDHRENILRPQFEEVGIGIIKGPYGYMCTQVFRATPD